MSTPNDKRHQTFAQRAAPKLQAAIDAMAATQPQPPQGERDPLRQDYLDACASEAEGRELEQLYGRPVDMFGQPVKEHRQAVVDTMSLYNEHVSKLERERDALQAKRDELLMLVKEYSCGAPYSDSIQARTRAAIARATEADK